MNPSELPKPELRDQLLSAAEVPVHSISVKLIKVKDRGRTDFGNIQELSDNIKSIGLINPILVSRNGSEFNLIAGERRLRAFFYLNRPFIDARILDECPPLLHSQIELDENVMRKELHWTEQAKILQTIHELMVAKHGKSMPGKDKIDPKTGKPKTGWSMEQTAQYVGKSIATVSQNIKAAKLLSSNPELKTQVEHLPLQVAIGEIEKKNKVEATKSLVASGAITLTKTLLFGNAVSLISQIPDNSISAIITDPPFGIQKLAEVNGKTINNNAMSYTAIGSETDNLDSEKIDILFTQLFPELYRVLKPGGHFWIFFSNTFYPRLVEILTDSKLQFDSVPTIWYKGTTAPFLGYRPQPCYEPILFAWKPDPNHPQSYGRKLNSACKSFVDFKPLQEKIHRYQKPLDLLTHLINLSTFQGDLILDPFAGSGSTLKAAIQSKRGAIGFELDHQNYMLAQTNLSET